MYLYIVGREVPLQFIHLTSVNMTIKDQICQVLIQKYGNETFRRKDVIQAFLDVRGQGETYNASYRGQYSYALKPETNKDGWGVTRKKGYLLTPSNRSHYYLDIQGRGIYTVQEA